MIPQIGMNSIEKPHGFDINISCGVNRNVKFPACMPPGHVSIDTGDMNPLRRIFGSAEASARFLAQFHKKPGSSRESLVCFPSA